MGLDSRVRMLRRIQVVAPVQQGGDPGIERLQAAEEVAGVSVLGTIELADGSVQARQVVAECPVGREVAKKSLPGVAMRVMGFQQRFSTSDPSILQEKQERPRLIENENIERAMGASPRDHQELLVRNRKLARLLIWPSANAEPIKLLLGFRVQATRCEQHGRSRRHNWACQPAWPAFRERRR